MPPAARLRVLQRLRPRRLARLIPKHISMGDPTILSAQDQSLPLADSPATHGRSMQLGHSCHSWPVHRMSAHPPTTAEKQASSNCCLGARLGNTLARASPIDGSVPPDRLALRIGRIFPVPVNASARASAPAAPMTTTVFRPAAAVGPAAWLWLAATEASVPVRASGWQSAVREAQAAWAFARWPWPSGAPSVLGSP